MPLVEDNIWLGGLVFRCKVRVGRDNGQRAVVIDDLQPFSPFMKTCGVASITLTQEGPGFVLVYMEFPGLTDVALDMFARLPWFRRRVEEALGDAVEQFLSG